MTKKALLPKKKTSRSPRFTGQPELWVSSCLSKVVIRDAKLHCYVIKVAEQDNREWIFTPFKEAWTFDFFNGSKYLTEKGFTLIERL